MSRNGESTQKPLTTADLASRQPVGEPEQPATGEQLQNRILEAREHKPPAGSSAGERLDPLFASDLAEDYRARWASVQTSFVDDPRQAVREGDELVAQVMQSLAQSFADERQKLESQLDQTDEGSTETLRVALRRYRSFFERLLAL